MQFFQIRKGVKACINFGTAMVLVLGLAGVSAAQGMKAPTLAELIAGAKNETTMRAQWSTNTLGGGPGLEKIVAGM
ncbi:MAG: hypothetical protein OEN50_04820, partial [Deltaproteobacteria bacterium]|nr:hypothetical protein [Deltaproteobacteria bacterium]